MSDIVKEQRRISRLLSIFMIAPLAVQKEVVLLYARSLPPAKRMIP